MSADVVARLVAELGERVDVTEPAQIGRAHV